MPALLPRAEAPRKEELIRELRRSAELWPEDSGRSGRDERIEPGATWHPPTQLLRADDPGLVGWTHCPALGLVG